MECSLRAARQRTVASSRQSNCRYIDRRFCCGPRFPHIETDCGNGRGLRPKDTVVDFDHSLNTAIKKIRCALGDEAGVPRYVETIPRRGYRFIGTVETAFHENGINTVDLSEHELATLRKIGWRAVASIG